MKEEFLLSIMVPTKNRYDYLLHLIRFFESLDSPLIEMVIQDNSTEDKVVKDFESQINDSRIRYYYTSDDLSMIQNWDLGIAECKGKYISILGDDDGFLPELIDCVKWMNENEVDNVFFEKPTYYWKDASHRVLKNLADSLLIRNDYTGKATKIDVQAAREKCLKEKGGTDISGLPKLYHSVASMDLLRKVYGQCGTYFPGPSPDMASAVAISFFSKSSYKIDGPLIMSGTAAKSAGGLGLQKKHIGQLKDVKMLPKDITQKWFEVIPFYWSGTTIYAQSFLQSITNFIPFAELPDYNIDYMLARCAVFDVAYKSEVKACIKEHGRNWKVAYYQAGIWGLRIRSFLSNYIFKSVNKFNTFNELGSITGAIEKATHETKTLRYPWR